MQLHRETLDGRPVNFIHGNGTGGLWHRYGRSALHQLPPRLCQWNDNNSDVMSPLFNGDELQGITLPLRLRANTFIPGAELAVFQPDSLAHEISHIELRINNHFQPSHPTITLDRLLFVKLNGRLYEPCPEFQLKTLARTAQVLYNVDYDVAYILATRSTLFDNTISYCEYVHAALNYCVIQFVYHHSLSITLSSSLQLHQYCHGISVTLAETI